MGKIYPVIMCGGAGRRLWPLSRKAKPKQFHNLVGIDSMLQQTVQRVAHADGLDVAAPSFACALDYEAQVNSQCRAAGYEPLRIILEPCARNTAPVAAIIALEFNDIDPDGLILLLPADHHVEDAQAFWQAVEKGAQSASQGYLTTFGITPTRPETGYGYIRTGASITPVTQAVDAFVEKPDQETAKGYLSRGDYFWNAGIFLFSPRDMLKAFEAQAQDILSQCTLSIEKAQRQSASLYLDPKAFSQCRSESIDYAIMEQAEKRAIVPDVMIGWSDIGSWEVIAKRALSESADDNAQMGDVVMENCKGVYARSDGPLIAAINVENLVIVGTKDAVMICSPDYTQNVKTIVTCLEESCRDDLL